MVPFPKLLVSYILVHAWLERKLHNVIAEKPGIRVPSALARRERQQENEDHENDEEHGRIRMDQDPDRSKVNRSRSRSITRSPAI